jgi:CheY-like chemotaxis protein
MSPPVLLVEDDPDIREDLAFLIECQGYQVETAENGRAALDILSAGTRPCLIVLDLMMPVMDGWQTHSQLQKSDEWAHIPVVLLSGIADIADKARNMRVQGYLKKPIDFDHHFGLLKTHCSLTV